ncbi:MAG: bifunctional DNA primase/polymerase [Nitrososphaerota archaeon]|nr:bifunctional DNA primase/polymerase [Nitrososphaerota archaeon]
MPVAESPFKVAWKLHTLGFTVIPSGGGDTHKVPLVIWQPYQDRRPSDEQIQAWEADLKPKLWGIVTGAKSGVVVLDADTAEQKASLEPILGSPFVITPRGGAHWYFKHPGHTVKTKAAVLTGVDIRADGGFVNIVGNRPDGNYEIHTLPTPNSLLPWLSLPEEIRALVNGSKPKVGHAIESTVIPEGQRNATLTSLAGKMRRDGFTQSAIEAALLDINQKQCQPPLTDEEVGGIAASVSRYPPNTDYINTCMYDASQQNTSVAKHNKTATTTATNEAKSYGKTQQEPLAKRIEDWIASTAGWFDTLEIDRELGIISTTAKNNRREIMLRLIAKGIVERHQKIAKQFRYINKKMVSLSFKTAATQGILPIKWPMGIERYVNLFPSNEVVIAGSPNAGKTALLLNFIYLNQDTFPIYYFCSEMGDVELRNRLEQFPGMSIEDWKFEAIDRVSDFADVIVPDCINVIDYLEITTELYLVNTHLTSIAHKLGSGLAVVALQKKQGASFGRGQEFGLEKPKLYLSMDRGKLQIVKAKSWANKKVDPCNLEISFKILGGCQFEITNGWDWKR